MSGEWESSLISGLNIDTTTKSVTYLRRIPQAHQEQGTPIPANQDGQARDESRSALETHHEQIGLRFPNYPQNFFMGFPS
jgi:hypothetical protein